MSADALDCAVDYARRKAAYDAEPHLPWEYMEQLVFFVGGPLDGNSMRDDGAAGYSCLPPPRVEVRQGVGDAEPVTVITAQGEFFYVRERRLDAAWPVDVFVPHMENEPN